MTERRSVDEFFEQAERIAWPLIARGMQHAEAWSRALNTTCDDWTARGWAIDAAPTPQKEEAGT